MKYPGVSGHARTEIYMGLRVVLTSTCVRLSIDSFVYIGLVRMPTRVRSMHERTQTAFVRACAPTHAKNQFFSARGQYGVDFWRLLLFGARWLHCRPNYDVVYSTEQGIQVDGCVD